MPRAIAAANGVRYLFEASVGGGVPIIKPLQSDLAANDISAERKSIYDDIIALGDLGYEIDKLPTRPTTYTLKNRPFTLAELKMLVDAVESSRFISKERSAELIKKLRRFAGRSASGELNRQVYIEDRVKTDNDASVENIDVIHGAINRHLMISFKYFDYTRKKEKI